MSEDLQLWSSPSTFPRASRTLTKGPALGAGDRKGRGAGNPQGPAPTREATGLGDPDSVSNCARTGPKGADSSFLRLETLMQKSGPRPARPTRVRWQMGARTRILRGRRGGAEAQENLRGGRVRLVRGHPWGGGGPGQQAAKQTLPGLCPGPGTLRTPDSLAAPTRAPRLERYTGSRWGRQSVLLLPSGGTASWSQVGKCKHHPPKPHRDSPTGAKNTPHWQQTSSPVFPKRQWATGRADLVGVR